MFLSLDGTSVIQLANFAVFFAVLYLVFMRPVSRAITKRREYMHAVAADYERYQTEAKALRAHADRVRADARREAEQTIAKARAEASNAAAELSTQYAQSVRALVEEAQAKAAAELQSARAGEEQLVRELADAMVERAVGEAAA